MAWYRYIGEYERYYEGSYCVNLWASNETEDRMGVTDAFWRTPGTRVAANVPLLLDGQWVDAEPLPDDGPLPYEEALWSENRYEMQRVCVNRHNGAVNGLYLDFSARKMGLKGLWRLNWHRQWDMAAPLPNPAWPGGDWPEWMQNFTDY